jgi:hypothetical protein
MLFARWVIPPCIAVAVVLRLSAPLIRDLKALLPEGFSLTAPRAPAPDLDQEIKRLLEGSQ